MALNTSRCNHLTPLRFKGLIMTLGTSTFTDRQFYSAPQTALPVNDFNK